MQKAVGYIRVSTDKQDYERQRDEITDYAEKMDFTIVRFFEDKLSGSNYEDRIGFQDLLLYLNENSDVKIIIFDEVSRMGRDTAQQVAAYKALTKKGVRVFTRGKGEFGHNKEDSMLFTVLSAVAEYEKQTIIDRTSSGRRKVVKGGATQISNRPYGYNLVLTKKKDRTVFVRQYLEVNKEEVPIVRKMFAIIDDRGGVNDILRYLIRNKIKSPSGNSSWGHSSVLRILHNTTYYGEWRFGKYYRNGKTKYSLSKRNEEDLIIVKVPAIISKSLFNRVQNRLSENKVKFNPKNQKHTYLLKGLICCQCESVMQCYFDKKSNSRVYRCPQRNIHGVSKKTCPIKTFKADFLERILLTELKDRIEDEEFFRDIKLKKLKTYKAPLYKLEVRKNRLEEAIMKDEGILKKYYEKSIILTDSNPEKAKIFEGLADDLVKKLNIAKQELGSLIQEIENIKSKEIDYSLFKDLKKGLNFITQQEIQKLTEAAQDKKLDFIRNYITKVKAGVLSKETETLRMSILQLRKKGIYKKENRALRQLYFTVVNKNHVLRSKTAIQIVELFVEFINNFTLSIRFPYFHEKPEIATSYLKNKKFKLTL